MSGRGQARGRGDFRGRGSNDDNSRGRGSAGGFFRGSDLSSRRGSPRDGFRGGGGERGFRGRDRGSPFREQGQIFDPGQSANVDARLENNSEDQLVASLQSLRLQDSDLPLRPGFGTRGTPIKLRTNFFPVKVPKGPLYEYDVTVTPGMPVKRVKQVKQRIFQLAERTNDWTQAGMTGRVAHDHASKLISADKLPQPLVIRVLVSDEEEDEPQQQQQPAQPKGGKKEDKTTPKEYTLVIRYAQDLETKDLVNYLHGHPQYRSYDVLPVVSALNLILAAHPNRSGGGVMVGRNKFFHPRSAEPPIALGSSLEAWRGFYSSVRPVHKQLMVNLNVCITAFYVPGSLAKGLQAFTEAGFGASAQAFVKGLQIKTAHLGYRKTIKNMSRFTADSYSFDSAEYGWITVREYFKKRYNVTLKYAHLPLVDVGGLKSNLLPAEVCLILERQSFRGKLLDEHTERLVTIACRPPNLNAAAIVNHGICELGYFDENDALRVFSISIGNEMSVIPGRLLQPPNIRYGQGCPRVDERAGWNLRDVKFAIGGRMDNWVVLLIRDGERSEFQGVNDPELRVTIDGFVRTCRKFGVNISPPAAMIEAQLPRKTVQQPIRADAILAIRAAMLTAKMKPALFFVILANGDRHVYSGIKHLCDCYLDISTICVQVAKIRKDKGQLLANVALKLNMKSGGVNHRVEGQNATWLAQQPTMLVGIDVTHPGPGTIKGIPSIAAVAASIDQNFGQFPASMRIQESQKEIVTDLADMMVERLQAFQAKSETLPQRIIVYRDGVSERQFNTVVREEVPEIRKSFRKFDTNEPYTPRFTIVICDKRHHTRFFPTDAQSAAGDGNPKPGTVVDRGITGVYEFDFFLQAHGGLKGTTRPTHYYVVHDDIGFSADLLQTLTNDLSYMFARATKAVSIVPPAYYADLACERGRCYLHKLLQGISGTTTSIDSDDSHLVFAEARRLWHNGVGATIRTTMFYL